MAKKKRREKSIAEYEAAVTTPGFRARKKQPHVAMEYRDNGNAAIAANLVRQLRLPARRCVLPDPHRTVVRPRSES